MNYEHALRRSDRHSQVGAFIAQTDRQTDRQTDIMTVS